MNRVYLAGPISGLNHEQASTWRDDVAKRLSASGIECFSPMRHTEDLRAEGVIIGEKEYNVDVNPMGTAKGIMSRDFFDVKRADLVLANLKGAENISIGTVMEIAWAWHMQKPVIVIAEKTNRHVVHLMMREAISIVVDDIDQAVRVVDAYCRNHVGSK